MSISCVCLLRRYVESMELKGRLLSSAPTLLRRGLCFMTRISPRTINYYLVPFHWVMAFYSITFEFGGFMPRYILNKNTQSTGENEIHNADAGCSFMPLSHNQIDLGFHVNCQSAIATAKRMHPSKVIDGCASCTPACHTR